MEDIKNNIEEVEKEEVNEPEVEETESVTMSKADYDKSIQSAQDKVRGKYSKEIRELKEKIKELTPVEKSESEIELEKRIAALEESERNLAKQKKRLDIQETLTSRGLDKNLVEYLKDDVDLDAFSGVIDSLIKGKIKSDGYKPSDHSSDDSVTLEEFAKMTYSQKVAVKEKYPELYKTLMSKR